MKAKNLDVLIVGRRKIDGNFCGRDGSATSRDGRLTYSPIYDWSHEILFGYLHYNGIELPEIYKWRRGFYNGTHIWAERNVRLHGDRQIKEYIRSIEMFGQVRPLVIDEDNVVLCGNGLLQALQQMGAKTADCYVVAGLSANKKKKLMLADNKIYELGVNNVAEFDNILKELAGDIDR